uniref:Integrase catalytic domain-containing protein n=1 Tax=Tanacetum cinerariifolium TaxID=118510 RepID=A0A6L2JH34_TANCI|nr:hypothetical protein [Tanacetum cinerariifolium]
MEHSNTTPAKISILDTGKFEQWKFRIQQYLQNEHYALWKVIEFRDSYEVPKESAATGLASDGKNGRTVAITTKDMQKRKNDVKARTTLLLALPDEHQLRFSKYKTAQELCVAILKTFGGNEATRKTKKNLLKQQYGNFTAEGKETLEQNFNRLHEIVSKLEFMDVEIKEDDLNQKLLTSLAPEWLMHTIVGNEEDNTASVLTASTQVSHIDEDDIEEMDIKWNMALLSMRADRFQKKTEKKFLFKGQMWLALISRRQGSKVEEHAPKGLMAIDEVGWDWSYMENDEENHALVADEEAPIEFALMAKTSTDNEVFDNSLCSKACKKNIDSLNSQIIELSEKLVFRRMVEFLGSIPINLKCNMWELEDLIEKPINWSKPSKNRDGAWHAKIRIIDPDGEEFTKTLQSIPTTRKLSKKESLREIINLDHFYDTLYLMRKSLEVLKEFYWMILGGRFNQLSHELNRLCKETGIARHLTVTTTPQQNGLAERMNMTLLNKVGCLLIQSGLLDLFWAEATVMTVYLINSPPSTALKKKTHMDLWDVVFNESLMYKDTLKSVGAVDSKKEFEFEVELQGNNYVLVHERAKITTAKSARYKDEGNVSLSRSSWSKVDDMVAYAFVIAEEEDTHEPITFHQAINSFEKDEWVRAIEEEMSSLKKNHTWELVDQTPAFLHGNLKETIYMRKPPGSKEGMGNKVCLLKKCLYGLKQSPRKLYKRFDVYMISNGFSRSNYDSCIYFKEFAPGMYIYLLLYVDDMLIACKSKYEIEYTKGLMRKEFDMKELGLTRKILGMEIVRDRGSRTLKDYPSSDWDVKRKSKVPYANVVDSLMYLMVCTRSDIAYAVTIVSRYLANLGKNYKEAVKWILKYLKGNTDVGPVYAIDQGKHVDVDGFMDVDYAKDPNKEYMALAEAIKESIWLKGLLIELGLNLRSVVVNCYNQGAIHLSRNSMFHERTNHINVRYHFIKEIVESRETKVAKIGTKDNATDAFIKINEGWNKESMKDIVSSDEEWEESDYGNPPNTTTDSFFKPCLNAQKMDDIEKVDDRSQMKRKGNNNVLNKAPKFVNQSNEQPSKRVYKAQKFEAIKYSLGPNEEYIAIRSC